MPAVSSARRTTAPLTSRRHVAAAVVDGCATVWSGTGRSISARCARHAMGRRSCCPPGTSAAVDRDCCSPGVRAGSCWRVSREASCGRAGALAGSSGAAFVVTPAPRRGVVDAWAARSTSGNGSLPETCPGATHECAGAVSWLLAALVPVGDGLHAHVRCAVKRSGAAVVCGPGRTWRIALLRAARGVGAARAVLRRGAAAVGLVARRPVRRLTQRRRRKRRRGNNRHDQRRGYEGTGHPPDHLTAREAVRAAVGSYGRGDEQPFLLKLRERVVDERVALVRRRRHETPDLRDVTFSVAAAPDLGSDGTQAVSDVALAIVDEQLVTELLDHESLIACLRTRYVLMHCRTPLGACRCGLSTGSRSLYTGFRSRATIHFEIRCS